MRISDWSSDVCSSDLFAYLQYLRTESASRAASEMVLALQDVSGSDILMPPMREAMLTAVQAAMLHFNETMKIVDDLKLCLVRNHTDQIGRASCRGRVCQYV